MGTLMGLRHQGWQQPVAVVDVDELHGPLEGVVQLPLRVDSSGMGPAETFDLSEQPQRFALYQIVLADGDKEALRRYINRAELRRLWPHLWLPAHVRGAWAAPLGEAPAS